MNSTSRMIFQSLLALFMALIAMPLLAQEFKEEWYGRYEGPLRIWQGGQLRQELDMKLEIRPLVPDSNWVWEISYISPEQTDVRAYELVRVDSIPGRYRIDEKNGIILDADLNEGVLFSNFQLGETWLMATYRFQESGLEFEIFTGNERQSRTTGGISEEIPEVTVFPLTVYQRATLKRNK